MENRAFDTFVEDQANQIQMDQGKSEISEQDSLTEWRNTLAGLFSQIQDYLESHLRSGNITFEITTKPVFEDQFGTYKAPLGFLMIGKKQVTIEPVGLNVIGSFGTVNMTGRSGKLRLVLLPQSMTSYKININDEEHGNGQKEHPDPIVWKIAEFVPTGIKLHEFNKDNFEKVLMEIA